MRKPIAGSSRREGLADRRAVCDAVNAIQGVQRKLLFTPSETEAKGGTTTLINNTSADLDALQIVGIGDVKYPPDTAMTQWFHCPVLKAEDVAAEHVDNWAIVLNGGTPQSAIYAAISGGDWPAKVEILDPSHTHVRAEVDNHDNLVTAPSGIARIIWKSGTEGVVFARITFSPLAGEVKVYELAETLLPDGTATAYPLEWDVVNSHYTRVSEDAVTLTDRRGDKWGVTGEYVEGIVRSTGMLEVTTSGRPFYQVTLTEDIDAGLGGGGTVTIGVDEQTVEVYDIILDDGMSHKLGDLVFVVPDVTMRKFVIIGKPLAVFDQITDMQWNATDKRIDVKTTTVAVVHAEPEGDWAAKINTSTITVLVGMQISGTALQYQPRDLYLFGAANVGDFVTWHTGTTC